MDDLPYRNSAIAHTYLPGRDQPSSADEREFSTLKAVREQIARRIEGLYKDFNAFDILKLLESPKIEDAQRKLLVQVMGKQEAYDILAEALEVIDTTMQTINIKYREK